VFLRTTGVKNEIAVVGGGGSAENEFGSPLLCGIVILFALAVNVVAHGA
jgi:hypothetical protein